MKQPQSTKLECASSQSLFSDGLDAALRDNVCTVRLTTTAWNDKKGLHTKKSLIFLKRKCKGYNGLEEDCSNIGAEEVFPMITNIDSMEDGIYEVAVCNESRDWESGHIDDYEYQLVSV